MTISHSLFLGVVLFVILQTSWELPQRNLSFREVNTCECGRSNDEIAARIVGGEIVQSNNYPWMVPIFFNGKMHCGGSLINDRYILTAGHCLHRLDKEDLQVFLGVRNLGDISASRITSGSKYEIERITVHGDFSSDYLHDTNDIGLIKLKRPVNFTDEIFPICMPRPGSNFDSKLALVAGWGRTNQGGSPSRSLRKAYLKVMSNKDCKNIPNIGEHIIDTMLCAYDIDADACQGDSGGPLVVDNGGKMEQIGIVSWGIGCASPGMPGVYTRMTSYLGWLRRRTQDAVYCRNK